MQSDGVVRAVRCLPLQKGRERGGSSHSSHYSIWRHSRYLTKLSSDQHKQLHFNHPFIFCNLAVDCTKWYFGWTQHYSKIQWIQVYSSVHINTASSWTASICKGLSLRGGKLVGHVFSFSITQLQDQNRCEMKIYSDLVTFLFLNFKIAMGGMSSDSDGEVILFQFSPPAPETEVKCFPAFTNCTVKCLLLLSTA